MRQGERQVALLMVGVGVVALALLMLSAFTSLPGLPRGRSKRLAPVTLAAANMHQYDSPAAAAVQCSACHLLSQPTESLAGLLPSTKEACLSCHPQQQEQITDFASRHRPFVQRECTACHRAHWDDASSSLRTAVPDLCLLCHGSLRAEQELSSRHPPFVGGQCTSCHDPHGSQVEALLKEEQKVLCLSCHKTVAANDLNQPFQHQPFAQGNCTSCHAPHASQWEPQLKAPVGELCTSCHAGPPVSVAVTHKPVTAGWCTSCHFAHASGVNDRFLRATAGELCLSCHRK